MKAILKVNYSELKKGDKVIISEVHEKFVTVHKDGRKIDFGFSEIQFCEDNNTLFELGRLIGQSHSGDFVMRNSDINRVIQTTFKSLPKTIKIKAYSHFIYN